MFNHARAIVLSSLLCLVIVGALGCSGEQASGEHERVATTSSPLDSRFDPSYPAPWQSDGWSCSVHTTTWMLQATGHGVSWTQVKNQMLGTGRVTTSLGLMNSNGTGIVATLRDYAGWGPEINNKSVVSFDEVAAKAGHMAVGIGGRSWNHWSAVRGYDAANDVILLANSAPNWKGAGQSLTRWEFSQLGSFAMVWMDFGQVPTESERPEGPFPALLVKAPVSAAQWVTQCTDGGERVWKTMSTGADPWSRWGEPLYPQAAVASCGPKQNGAYPIVFRSASAGSIGAWVVMCASTGNQHVFRTDTTVDGHPAAVYLYDEAAPDCP